MSPGKFVKELIIPKKKKLFCNKCKTDTNHSRKSSHRRIDYEDLGDDFHLAYEFNYVFWICAGCDRGTLEEIYTDDSLRYEDNMYCEYTYYPPRNLNFLSIKHFLKLPIKLKNIYNETINAYNSDLYILSAVGLRSLIEGICDDQKITGNNLEKKIDGLTKFLPSNIVKNLHSLRFMGNTAVHNLDPSNRKDLKIGTEVIEDILNFIYELDYKSGQLIKNKTKKNK